LVELDYPSGQTLHYSFGPDNRLSQVRSTAIAPTYPGDPGAPANRTILTKQRFGDLVTNTTLGNGASVASFYDPAGRRIADRCTFTQGSAFLMEQLWDDAGNRVLDIEGEMATLSGLRREYDSTDRLIASVTVQNPQPLTTDPLAPPVTPLAATALQCQQKIDAIGNGYGIQIPSQPDFAYDATGNRELQSGRLVYTANARNEYLTVGADSPEEKVRRAAVGQNISALLPVAAPLAAKGKVALPAIRQFLRDPKQQRGS
jgi:hypothetical protein